MPDKRTSKAQKTFGKNLKKAKIIVLEQDLTTKKEIPVLFNPSEYSLSKNNTWKEANKRDLNTPMLQFANCECETLSLDLIFDSYEDRKDVRLHTDEFAGLMHIDPRSHKPYILKFVWGSMVYLCVLVSVKQTFTLFLSDGTPVRAKLSVSFMEWGPEANAENHELHSSDRTKVHIINEGDSLWSIAAKEYNDAAKWKYIAERNGISNPRILETGMRLEIPPL